MSLASGNARSFPVSPPLTVSSAIVRNQNKRLYRKCTLHTDFPSAPRAPESVCECVQKTLWVCVDLQTPGIDF